MFGARHAPYALAPEVVAELARRYGEPHRAYHDASHIAELLGWFDAIAADRGWRAPRDVYDAIVFHDAIYEPLAARGANEACSAGLARRCGASSRAAELIALTARHGEVTAAELGGDPDAAGFLDADAAILGADPADFDRYDAAIAREYAAVPEAAFRAGRRAFLAGMAARDRIFLTDRFHAALDGAARANLARAVARYG